jgi:hypothetical protein
MTLADVLFLEQDRRLRAYPAYVQTFTKRDQVNPRNVAVPYEYGTSERVPTYAHGTLYAYDRYRCRCEPCRRAKSTQHKRRYLATRRKFTVVQHSLFQEPTSHAV